MKKEDFEHFIENDTNTLQVGHLFILQKVKDIDNLNSNADRLYVKFTFIKTHIGYLDNKEYEIYSRNYKQVKDEIKSKLTSHLCYIVDNCYRIYNLN